MGRLRFFKIKLLFSLLVYQVTIWLLIKRIHCILCLMNLKKICIFTRKLYVKQLHFVCCCLVSKSCPTVLHSHGLWPARLLCPWDSPGKKTREGWHFLLQGIFLIRDQIWVSCIGRQILYHWATGEARLSITGIRYLIITVSNVYVHLSYTDCVKTLCMFVLHIHLTFPHSVKPCSSPSQFPSLIRRL